MLKREERWVRAGSSEPPGAGRGLFHCRWLGSTEPHPGPDSGVQGGAGERVLLSFTLTFLVQHHALRSTVSSLWGPGEAQGAQEIIPQAARCELQEEQSWPDGKR